LKQVDGFLTYAVQRDKLLENEALTLLFRLSDIYVEYLLGQDVIQEFLNKNNHWIFLFHYILGKFPPKRYSYISFS
jgi:hypothetical protein